MTGFDSNDQVERTAQSVDSLTNIKPLSSFELLKASPPATYEQQPTRVWIPTLEIGDDRTNVSSPYSSTSAENRIYEANRQSVVRINTYDRQSQIDGKGSTGTGFFIDKDGMIATGYHVVRDALSIKVITEDGRSYDATVKQVDPSKDVALLQVQKSFAGEQFKPVEMETSSSSVGGERRLVALGYPNNEKALHLSDATMKGRSRFKDLNVKAGALPGEDVNREIMYVRSHVNNGNSGGPVFDAITGKVVGIVNMNDKKIATTYLNPVDDLQNFIARIQRPVTDQIMLALSGSSTLSAQLRFLRDGAYNTIVAAQNPVNASMVPPYYANTENAGITRGGRVSLPSGARITTSEFLQEFKRR